MELFLRLIAVLLNTLCILLAPVYWLVSKFNSVVSLQPIRKPVFSLSARQIAEKIRTGELNCEDVMHSYLFRCKRVNIQLNAVTDDRYDKAMYEADRMDEFIASNTKTVEELEQEMPLLGVPITVSECCKVEGISYTLGSIERGKKNADCDGEVVRLLRKAGAIPVAVTNQPELCLGTETCNLIHGLTVNPYDFHRTVGGSAGGEAALVSTAASIVGVGSDFVGSLRGPAMYTGIFGHRPTPRCVPTKGFYPDIDDNDDVANHLVLGPMTRFAEDLPVMMKVMAGDSVDKLRLDQQVDLKDLNVYYMTEAGYSIGLPTVDKEIKLAITKAVNYLQSTFKCTTQKATFSEMSECPEISGAVLFNTENTPDIFDEINPDSPKERPNVYKEFLKSLFGLTSFSATSLQYQLMKMAYKTIPEEKMCIYKKKNEMLKKSIIETLGDDGVLIFPTLPSAAHYHHQALLRAPELTYCAIITSLGLPATNIPMGLNKRGLPIGFQVVAAPYQDRLCFAIAQELEKAFGGWVHPPCINIRRS